VLKRHGVDEVKVSPGQILHLHTSTNLSREEIKTAERTEYALDPVSAIVIVPRTLSRPWFAKASTMTRLQSSHNLQEIQPPSSVCEDLSMGHERLSSLKLGRTD
jgi:hypothetical protein